MMKTCQQNKQMNVKDKVTQNEHKQPREIHKSINRFLEHIKKKKHVAEYMKQLLTFSFGFC